MQIRDYDPARDRQAAWRIWREIGWLDEKHRKETFWDFVECGRALVAEVGGEAECLVSTATGTLRYLDEELPWATPTGVAVSPVARKLGAGSRTTALAIAQDAADGTALCGVWVFDQGFYSRLGYGNGAYEHSVAFDPAQLLIDVEARVPRRLSASDWQRIHACRLARRRGHGSVTMTAPHHTRLDIECSRNGYGLGYCDGPHGELTHHFWWSADSPEHGPYHVYWMSYQSDAQFLELMALIKSLGDQIRLVQMREPQGIQLQDLLDRPSRHRGVTRKSDFEVAIRAWAYWQMRICDLAACLEATHLDVGPVRFNLELSDPIERHLDDSAPWLGIAGNYVVELGPTSGAEAGSDDSLPTLRASVGAFTRLWLGIRPATGLAVTDDLAGPPELLEALDDALRLPVPKPDWDF